MSCASHLSNPVLFDAKATVAMGSVGTSARNKRRLSACPGSVNLRRIACAVLNCTPGEEAHDETKVLDLWTSAEIFSCWTPYISEPRAVRLKHERAEQCESRITKTGLPIRNAGSSGNRCEMDIDNHIGWDYFLRVSSPSIARCPRSIPVPRVQSFQPLAVLRIWGNCLLLNARGISFP